MWGWILGGSREWKPGKFKNRAWQLCKWRWDRVTSAVSGIQYQVSRFSFRTQCHPQATKPTTAAPKSKRLFQRIPPVL
jgi:hypothetical protein